MLFDSNLKLNKDESNTVLEAVVGFLGDGQTILASLKYTSEIFGGKIEKVLLLLENDVLETSIPIAEAMQYYGVLTEEEAALFAEGGTSARESISEIIKLREYGSIYEKIIWGGLRSTILFFFAVSIGLFFYIDELNAMMVKIVADSASGEVMSIGEMNILPIYMINKWILIWWCLGLLALWLGIKYTYKHYYNTNREIIYKVFKSKSYDDLPRLFRVMSRMQKGGKFTTIQIFNHLSNTTSYAGLHRLFENLHEAGIQKEKFYPFFEQANFPKDVVVLIRAKEDTNFWTGIDSLVSYTKNKANNEYEKMSKKWDIANMVLPWIYPTYIMTEISFAFAGALNIG